MNTKVGYIIFPSSHQDTTPYVLLRWKLASCLSHDSKYNQYCVIVVYSQRNLPRRDTSAGLWVTWWEPEPRSWRPGWDSRGPSERLPEPAWSWSGSGTPWAGTGCGTATRGSGSPGRRCCCRRGAARSPALSLKGTTHTAVDKGPQSHPRTAESLCVRARCAGNPSVTGGQCPLWRISIN